MSENPHLLIEDADRRLRALQREIAKCRAQVLVIAQHGDAGRTRNVSSVAAHVLARLDSMQALAEVPALTRLRQDRAAAAEPVEPPGPPEGLRCKLCGEEKPERDFFFDDGQGHYGFTGRCSTCRGLPKRERRKIAARRGLGRDATERAVGSGSRERERASKAVRSNDV